MEGDDVSIIKVHRPVFCLYHDMPVVTWQVGDGPIRTDVNMLAQYRSWRSGSCGKHEPAPVFWESRGPEVVRALEFCGAAAVILEHVGDRRVAYLWFARERGLFSGSEEFRVCSVSVEGGTRGLASRVTVTLPTDEDVMFTFSWNQMQLWRKPDVADGVAVSQVQAP